MTILAQMMMKLLHEKVYNLLAFKKMPNKSIKIKIEAAQRIQHNK